MRGWAVAISLFGIVMALGDQNVLYRLIAGNLDLVAEFRVPARYLLLAYFPLAAAAALGADALLGRDLGRLGARARQGLGGLAVVGLVLGFALLVGGHSDWVESRRWWALAAAAGALAWLAAGFRAVPRVLVALVLLGVTGVELQQARPAAEYHQLVPDVAYDDPGPVMERLGRERGRYVTIAWDRPTTAEERRSVAAPAGYDARMRRYYREAWPRRLAARPAWEYATNAETISGRDGGLLPLRTYQEFFAAAVNPEGRLTAGVTTQAPSKWGWPALDLLGVRWFVTNGLPPGEIRVMEGHGFRVVQREAFFLLWARPAPPLARMVHRVDVVADPAGRLSSLEAGYPDGERALVERPLPGLARPARPAQVQVTRRDHTRVEVSVRRRRRRAAGARRPLVPAVAGRGRRTAGPAAPGRPRLPRGPGARRHPPGGVPATRTGPCGPAWSSAAADRPGPGRAVVVAPAPESRPSGPSGPRRRLRVTPGRCPGPLPSRQETTHVQAVILAGGFGTRLRPLTSTRPKP